MPNKSCIAAWLCLVALSPWLSNSRAENEIPTVKFTDITVAAGIKFIHRNGAYGDKLLPETMGGGVAFLDYDNDGRTDLLFINSTYWPGHIPPGKQPTTLALYHNDGQGQFERFQSAAAIEHAANQA